MRVIDASGLAVWISDLGLRAELEQSFIAVKHELLIAGVQLCFERPFAGEGVFWIDRIDKGIMFIPFNALGDEAVDDVRSER